MKKFEVGDKVEGYFIDNSQDPENASYSNIKVKGVVQSVDKGIIRVAFEGWIFYASSLGYSSYGDYNEYGRIASIMGQGIWHIDNEFSLKDVVWSKRNGRGTVVSINDHELYSIRVKWDNDDIHQTSYTKDGREGFGEDVTLIKIN